MPMHPIILALADPAFQDALFPRDSDLDEFLARWFPSIFDGSRAFSKTGKLNALRFVHQHDQTKLMKALEEYVQLRDVAMVLSGREPFLAKRLMSAGLVPSAIDPDRPLLWRRLVCRWQRYSGCAVFIRAPMSNRIRRLRFGCRSKPRW
ncbi:MAG: hypothetical protein U0787_12100 [Polyangia bacterium]